MEWRYLTLEEMNQAVRQLQGGLRQIEVADRFAYMGSNTSKLLFGLNKQIQ